MFYCAITGRLSKPGDTPSKILLAKREKSYYRWVRNEETNQWEKVFVAKGWEIVKEVDASREGEQEWNSWDNDQRWLYIKTNFPHLVKMTEDSEDAIRIALEEELVPA